MWYVSRPHLASHINTISLLQTPNDTSDAGDGWHLHIAMSSTAIRVASSRRSLSCGLNHTALELVSD